MTSKHLISSLIVLGGGIFLWTGCGIGSVMSTPPRRERISGQYHIVSSQQPSPSLTPPLMPRPVASLSVMRICTILYSILPDRLAQDFILKYTHLLIRNSLLAALRPEAMVHR